ncbi:MAG: 5-formyltetrahydrofolate cyclo-ligase [Treponema sp.]|nr:5-formyltetrahydrofolate cyclo-ligase [Treponema sp.]
MSISKQELRKSIKSLCEQNKDNLAAQSKQICELILASPQYKDAEQIFAYMALADEVDLGEVIRSALRDGKKVALPKIMDFEKGVMQFFYLDTVQTLNSQTQAGTLGISEPDPKLLQAADANTLKDSSILILVPGRAFTKEGDRLGRGKGFYDRFLADDLLRGARDAVMAGVCFDFQIKKSLPVDDRDIRMNLVF